MRHGIFTLDHVSKYKIIQTLKIECPRLFQNNNNNIVNNQIFGHIAAHHLLSIVTKIVAF